MDQILAPIEIAISYVMVGFYKAFTFLGMGDDSGWTWALSIVGLVVVIRILLVPLFVKQIKASRAMQIIAPDLKKIQNKYKGKKDQASREAMSRETMELYQKHKTNPFASCLPILVQAPIFFALFRVLNYKLKEGGIGALTADLASSFDQSSIFGARLSDYFNGTFDADFVGNVGAVRTVAAVLIVAMVSTTFLTQRQLTRKNMPASALEGPMAQQQKILMYVFPFIFVISGPIFPIGVLIYWTTTNLWTMGQQFYVIRRNPTPGSEAEKIYKERMARKKKSSAAGLLEDNSEVIEAPEATPRQRQQPQRKNRKKK